jgi:hypothetical protein
VESTEQQEIVELRSAPFGPVLDVMGVAELQTTAWKTTAPVAMGQRPPQSRWH